MGDCLVTGGEPLCARVIHVALLDTGDPIMAREGIRTGVHNAIELADGHAVTPASGRPVVVVMLSRGI